MDTPDRLELGTLAAFVGQGKGGKAGFLLGSREGRSRVFVGL